MTTMHCAVIGCGRTKGVTGPYQACEYHRADFRAGVSLDLRTGYTIYLNHHGEIDAKLTKDVFGSRHEDWHPGETRAFLEGAIQRIHGKIKGQLNESGEAVLPTPLAVTNHR